MERGYGRAWSPAMGEMLRGLWAEGHSTVEIARRLGTTKNAIVGRADRMNLPSRPSPIRRQDGAKAVVVARERTAKPVVQPAASRPAGPGLAARLARRPPAPPVLLEKPVPVPRAPRAAGRCCLWPLWKNDERPTHRYCDAPRSAAHRVPYCAEHAARAISPRWGSHPGGFGATKGWGSAA